WFGDEDKGSAHLHRQDSGIKLVVMRTRFSLALLSCAGALLTSSVQALELPLTEGHDVVGNIQVVEARYEDTFADMGERHGLGFTEMLLANPKVDPWLPGEGVAVVLPQQFLLPSGPRRGIVINLAEYRLYYYSDKNTEVSYAIG